MLEKVGDPWHMEKEEVHEREEYFLKKMLHECLFCMYVSGLMNHLTKLKKSYILSYCCLLFGLAYSLLFDLLKHFSLHFFLFLNQ